MRCPDCNRFVSQNIEEPTIDDDLALEKEEITHDPQIPFPPDFEVTISCSAQVVLTCAECGTELKEAYLDLEHKTTINSRHYEHELDVSQSTLDSIERSEGKGRGTKTFYGAEVGFEVRCVDCDILLCAESMSEEVQSSHMDELC